MVDLEEEVEVEVVETIQFLTGHLPHFPLKMLIQQLALTHRLYEAFRRLARTTVCL
jgi:hypothetical protein